MVHHVLGCAATCWKPVKIAQWLWTWHCTIDITVSWGNLCLTAQLYFAQQQQGDCHKILSVIQHLAMKGVISAWQKKCSPNLVEKRADAVWDCKSMQYQCRGEGGMGVLTAFPLNTNWGLLLWSLTPMFRVVIEATTTNARGYFWGHWNQRWGLLLRSPIPIMGVIIEVNDTDAGNYYWGQQHQCWGLLLRSTIPMLGVIIEVTKTNAGGNY